MCELHSQFANYITTFWMLSSWLKLHWNGTNTNVNAAELSRIERNPLCRSLEITNYIMIIIESEIWDWEESCVFCHLHAPSITQVEKLVFLKYYFEEGDTRRKLILQLKQFEAFFKLFLNPFGKSMWLWSIHLNYLLSNDQN